MRVFLKHQCVILVFAIVLTTFAFSASGVPAKDHKKKLLEKLRNALNQTELEQMEASSNSSGGIEVGEESEGLEGNAEAKTTPSGDDGIEKAPSAGEETESSTDEENKKEEVSDNENKVEGSSTEIQKGEGPTSYLLKMKTILKRIFDMFGFRQSKKKEGRQDRMLAEDESYTYNGLEYEYFKDDIKTTVGAVLGEKECIQKIICGAGSYLREVNGKHVILTILENVAPSAWTETMELLKKSAVTDGLCEYKCLEDGN